MVPLIVSVIKNQSSCFDQLPLTQTLVIFSPTNTLRQMPWVDIATARPASVRWVTQAPINQHELIFKGNISLQRYGGSKLFRLACEGRYYRRNGTPVVALFDERLNKVSIPLPSEENCRWQMVQSSSTCSNGIETTVIQLHFSDNDDGIHRLFLTVPIVGDEDDKSLVESIIVAHQQHEELLPAVPL